MLHTMFARKSSGRALPLGWQIMLLVVIKIVVLTGIWYGFIREHKVPHGVPETTQHILT